MTGNILEHVVNWIIDKIVQGLDFISNAMLGALGCDLTVFKKMFPIANELYNIILYSAISLILLNWIWQLFKNFFLHMGTEAEDPFKLTIRSITFIFLTFYAGNVVDIVLRLGQIPYNDLLKVDPSKTLSFVDMNGIIVAAITIGFSSIATIIAVVIVVVIAWNYLKLMLEAAERYIVVGILAFTAPFAFAMGASQTTSNVFKSWCRMLGGQVFLLIMNVWCVKMFLSMIGEFIKNPFLQ